MVELDSLENCCGASHRGFESHSLRFFRIHALNDSVQENLTVVRCGSLAILGQ